VKVVAGEVAGGSGDAFSKTDSRGLRLRVTRTRRSAAHTSF